MYRKEVCREMGLPGRGTLWGYKEALSTREPSKQNRSHSSLTLRLCVQQIVLGKGKKNTQTRFCPQVGWRLSILLSVSGDLGPAKNSLVNCPRALGICSEKHNSQGRGIFPKCGVCPLPLSGIMEEWGTHFLHYKQGPQSSAGKEGRKSPKPGWGGGRVRAAL